MKSSLLATKFYFPPGRPVLVSRLRLVERLQAGLKGPLTLISAPAGSGKTTLLSEWRAEPGAGVPVAWLSLESADNDPTRFFQYLYASLDTVQPGLAIEIEVSLRSTEELPPEVILTPLINTINKSPQDFILVLDDYHLIDHSTIHAALSFLLDHLPSPLHLVILTRSDPPLALARLRARGQLTEIRAEHLRFTVDEAARFMNQMMGLNLTADQVSALEKRTEGWIAGLQLAALSLQARQDVDDFVATFTGSNHYIVDYLVEEVLGGQPEFLREFLLKTSILERFNGELCDALTGETSSGTLLKNLEHANLFVIPLDNEQHWYRYHHLFADTLRSRLLHAHPELVIWLHSQASEWFETRGFAEEAILHSLEARDFERATILIKHALPEVTRQGRVSTLSRWITALPETIINQWPELRLSLAWALYFKYQFDQSEACIQQIEQNLSPENAPRYQGELALWHGIIARRHGDLEKSRILLEQALQQLSPENSALLSRAWVFLGLVYVESDIKRAREAFLQAYRFLESANNSGIFAVLYFLSWTQILQGELAQAYVSGERALQFAEKAPQWPVSCYAHLAMAEILCERNELEQAEQHAQRAIALAESGGHTDNLTIAILDASRINRASGNWNVAQNYIERAEKLVGPTIPWMKSQIVAEQISLYLAQNKPDEAVAYFHDAQTRLTIRSPIPRLNQQIQWARVQIARHEPQAALTQLEKLLEEARNFGLLRWVIQIHCLQAVALNSLGRAEEAYSQLKLALDLAASERSIQVFLEDGLALSELLFQVFKKGIVPSFCSRLVEALANQGYKESAKPAHPQTLLSKREVELLKLIASGCSNKEIASQLVISIGTVKRHTVNIFTKLDVKNRTEAVAKARELGLL